jgi:hypothetical protein
MIMTGISRIGGGVGFSQGRPRRALLVSAFCVETLEDALARHGRPDIFNTGTSSNFKLD